MTFHLLTLVDSTIQQRPRDARFRQADQKVAEALLGAVPKDIDLEQIYGLKAVPALPVVDMVVKQATVNTSM